jgi:hypothetical protein
MGIDLYQCFLHLLFFGEIIPDFLITVFDFKSFNPQPPLTSNLKGDHLRNEGGRPSFLSG